MSELTPKLRIAVGIVSDNAGRILITQRQSGTHLAGLWEFPGGKIESEESSREGLCRELKEETGQVVDAARRLIGLTHCYPERTVELDVWRVTRWHGEVDALEGQPIQWVSSDELKDWPMPDANRAIIHAICLPSLYVITDDCIDRNQFLSVLEDVLSAGVRMIQLRVKTVEGVALEILAKKVLEKTRSAGAKLIVNAQADLVRRIGADGVHLTTQRLMACTQRPLPDEFLVGASCHNASELAHAKKIGADFSVLSPVLPTATHPGAPTLGWQTFADCAASAGMPTYALGGMQVTDYNIIYEHGGQGAAVLGGVWRVTDPGAAARDYLGQATD